MRNKPKNLRSQAKMDRKITDLTLSMVVDPLYPMYWDLSLGKAGSDELRSIILMVLWFSRG